MRYTYSQKKLYSDPNNDTMSFYKNFQLKTIKSQYKLDPKLKYDVKNSTKRNRIRIEKTPWNTSISRHDINYLLKRLTDTPQSLYKALQNKNKENSSILSNKNKFKPLLNISISNQDNDVNNEQNKTINRVKLNLINLPKENNKRFRNFSETQDKSRYHSSIITQKQRNNKDFPKLQYKSNKQQRILEKIQDAKKKYMQQYRKMLLGMKAINLDTDLPRIKYVQQNQQTNRINLMHKNNKL